MIAATLLDLRAAVGPHVEIVVVDDASDDATAALATGVLSGSGPYRVISNAECLGKGGAIKRGVAIASGDMVGYTDADGAVPGSVWSDALGIVRQDPRCLVLGRRTGRRTTRRRIAGAVYRACARVVLGLGGDIQAPFKLAERSVLHRLCDAAEPDGFAFDTWLVAAARADGVRLVWADVPWIDRAESSSFNVATVAAMLRDLLSARDRFGRIRRSGG